MIRHDTTSAVTRIAALALLATAWAGGAWAFAEFSQENKGAEGAAVFVPQSTDPPPAALAMESSPALPAGAVAKALTLPVPAASVKNMSADALMARLRTVSATPDGRVESHDLSPEVRERVLDALRRIDAQPVAQAAEGDAIGDSPLPVSPEFAIFGKDTRDRITNTRAYPFRTIGFLGGGCSGTLVGRRHVLTAGHCLYDPEKNQWKTVPAFWPGQNGQSSPYGKAKVVRLVSIMGWTREHDWNFDIGMAVLGADIGDTVGWMSFGWERPLPLYNINLIGYPSDKERFTMWHSYCPIEKATELKLSYKCAQVPGNSGGPIYVHWPNKNLNRIIGVASHEQINGSSGFREGEIQHYPANANVDLDNGGTLIDKIKFETLKGWMEQY
jgi:V8-like Glu-specific endopeptidase